MKKYLMLLIVMGAFMLLFPIRFVSAAPSMFWQLDSVDGSFSKFESSVNAILRPNQQPLDVEYLDGWMSLDQYKVMYYSDIGEYEGNENVRQHALASNDPFSVVVTYDSDALTYYGYIFATVEGQAVFSYRMGDNGKLTFFSEYRPSTSGTEIFSRQHPQGFAEYFPILPTLGFDNPDWNSFYASPITFDSAVMNWKQNEVKPFQYRIRVQSFDDLAMDGMFYYVPSSESEYMSYELSGLKPGAMYNVYLESSDASGNVPDVTSPPVVTFRTQKVGSPTFSVSFQHGVQLVENAENYVQDMGGFLKVDHSGYTSAQLFVNGSSVGSQSFDSGLGITSFSYDSFSGYLSSSGRNAFTLNLVTKDGSNETHTFIVVSNMQPPSSLGDSVEPPQVPTPPDSSGDLVGWMKYLIDWLLYLVDAFVWIVSRAGSIISSVYLASSGLVAIIASFFSFLPPEITTVLVLGMLSAVILRFVGR